MKTKKFSLIILTIILMTGIAFCVESQSENNRPVIGIALDTTPLPSLLEKHLGLKSGQGIRVGNIMKGSSAEEEGLDIDDIVIAIQGQDLYNRETLTNKVSKLGVGAEVSMEVIHLGQRKTVNLKLKAFKDTTGWKYQNKPQIVNTKSYQPGSVYVFDPNEGWKQIFDEQIPENIKSNTIFNELFSSTSFVNGKMCSVTIHGSPENKDSSITVKIDNNDYTAKIGEIDKLPKEYQETAKNAVESAKQKETNRFPMFFDESGDNLMSSMDPGFPLINTPDFSGNPYFQKMEEQMRLMREQFEQLEQNHQKLLDSLKQNEQ